MKRHLAWWVVLGLLLLGWIPFGVAELFHTLSGLNYYPDEQVGLMFGVWLFLWWPCHVLAGLIILYKAARWTIGFLSRRKSRKSVPRPV
jgi:hypothetical protein